MSVDGHLGCLHVLAIVTVLLSSCSAQTFHFCGFSCCRTWALGTQALVNCSTQSLEHRLLLRVMWDPLRPGIEPVSPSLAGRFFTTELLGKPFSYYWKYILECQSFPSWMLEQGLLPSKVNFDHQVLDLGGKLYSDFNKRLYHL